MMMVGQNVQTKENSQEEARALKNAYND